MYSAKHEQSVFCLFIQVVSLCFSESLLPHSHGSSVDFVLGGTGIGQPLVKYPQLDFQPCHFFALGSPVAMFLTVRGVEQLGDEFKFPTCPSFFNIFHPVSSDKA